MQSAPSLARPSSPRDPSAGALAREPPLSASAPSPSAAPSRPRAAASTWALVLALVALLGSVAAMAFVGLTVVPMETASGYYLTDTPAPYQAAVFTAFGTLLLWSALGIAALVLGIVALVARRGTARAIAAIALATAAPVLLPLVLLGAMAVDIARF